MTDTTPSPPPDQRPEALPPLPDSPRSEPAVPTNELRPGAGQPLVQGPPASVGPPVQASLFNLAGGVGCVAIGVGALIVLAILLVILFRVL